MNRHSLIVLSCFALSGCSVSPTKSNSEKLAEIPKLTKPVVRKIWVQPGIEENGKVYRDGYYKYLLENESVWSR